MESLPKKGKDALSKLLELNLLSGTVISLLKSTDWLVKMTLASGACGGATKELVEFAVVAPAAKPQALLPG
jgi:hypothetical protein